MMRPPTKPTAKQNHQATSLSFSARRRNDRGSRADFNNNSGSFSPNIATTKGEERSSFESSSTALLRDMTYVIPKRTSSLSFHTPPSTAATGGLRSSLASPSDSVRYGDSSMMRNSTNRSYQRGGESMSGSTSRLNQTNPAFGVTMGGKNAFFNFNGDATLSATRVLAQERNQFEAFAAAQLAQSSVPNDLPAFILLQYRHREDYGKIGAIEASARTALVQLILEDRESIFEFERCKARADMAKFRHSVAVSETGQRKVASSLNKLLVDEPAKRVTILVNEEKVRACMGRWEKVEGEAIDLRERMASLQVFEERRRRVRVMDPEGKEWAAIIHDIEVSGLHRRSINPFGICPFTASSSSTTAPQQLLHCSNDCSTPTKLGAVSSNSPRGGGCPFSTPHGCHGLPIDRRHFTTPSYDHHRPHQGTDMHLPPIASSPSSHNPMDGFIG